MSQHSLGAITVPTPGTPVRMTFNQADPTKQIACNSIFAEAIPQSSKFSGNKGWVFILDRPNPNYTTGMGVMAALPPPTATVIPIFTPGVMSSAAINVADYWIDAEQANDGVLASYLR